MPDDLTEYEITYSLRRKRATDDNDDPVEIGFGATGLWSTPGMCAHMLMSAVQNGEWETEQHMPPADEVMAELEAYGV